MPLSWNEIRTNAREFSKKYDDVSSERSLAQEFWRDFFACFGLKSSRVASFEEPVKHLDGKRGWIDLFWKGTLLIEHKSRGQSLDKAYTQALDYFPGLKERDLPRYVIVSDFSRIRLYDLETSGQWDIPLANLAKNVELFGFIAGYQLHTYKEQDPVNIKAAEMMGRLHDQLRARGYQGHPLEVTLVRLLFCMFAEDTGIFDQRNAFRDFIEEFTREDGMDLGPMLSQLFEVLNTSEESRPAYFKQEPWNGFPYVNGKLFSERLAPPSFDRDMREVLLDASALDWGKISPSIFGALFQSVMDPAQRRNMGAHYTSEKNIMKVIRPLFVDKLRAEFEKIKDNHKLLEAFRKKLATLRFFDPACGCGNFLVIAYRELRLLEIEALRASRKWGLHSQRYQALDVKYVSQCDVDQFYGIELEEFPAQIAQVAMWLMDHQMNVALSEELGEFIVRVPLVKSANIHNSDALELDWRKVVDPAELDYILGNPPFVGSKMLSEHQREQMARLFGHVSGTKVLDFVAAWYLLASEFIQGTHIECALVSTSSIVQGEQVSILWAEMLRRGIKIHFAHKTFRWSNEARGKAAVHCVILGFAAFDTDSKTLFEYADVDGEPHAVVVKNINPYLVDAENILVTRRNAPLQDVPRLRFGNMPLDGGNLLMTDTEKDALLGKEPLATKFIKRFLGAEEFLNNGSRWCLWLVDAKPEELKRMPEVMKRIEAVRDFRLASKAPSTRAHAITPALFRDRNHPLTDYLIVPKVSSERRHFIPIGYIAPDTVASDLLFIIEGTTLFHFGVLSSSMHMAWTRYVAGRLESRYRYSKDIVYNNFPWPWQAVDKYRNVIVGAAQRVLEARAAYPDASLAALYDPLTMPEPLAKAHRILDKAVDSAYGRPSGFTSDAERMLFLLELYQTLTTPLTPSSKLKRCKKS